MTFMFKATILGLDCTVSAVVEPGIPSDGVNPAESARCTFIEASYKDQVLELDGYYMRSGVNGAMVSLEDYLAEKAVEEAK